MRLCLRQKLETLGLAVQDFAKEFMDNVKALYGSTRYSLPERRSGTIIVRQKRHAEGLSKHLTAEDQQLPRYSSE